MLAGRVDRARSIGRDLDHAAWLRIKIPLVFALDRFFFGQAIPPAIIVRRVRVRPYPAPGASAVGFTWIASDTGRQSLDHGKRQLARLVTPAASYFQGQEFTYRLSIVQGQEDYFTI